jgi:hypothetical protein
VVTVYNTGVSVVANLEAASEAEAIAKLRTALRRAGFDAYGSSGDGAFEAEEGTELTPLPDRL